MPETVGWDPQSRRRRAGRKIGSDARRGREFQSSKGRSQTTKVGKWPVAEIEDADGRANGSSLELLNGCKEQVANNCLIPEASGTASEAWFKRLRRRC